MITCLLAAACHGDRASPASDAGSTARSATNVVTDITDPAARTVVLENLVRANLDAELALHPTLGTWLGDRGYDDRLDDVRTDAQLREATRLRQLGDQLRAFSEQGLSRAARLDRTLLLKRTEAALHELSELRPLERSPIYYVDLAQAGVESLVSDGPTLDPDTLRALNGRLWRVRALFDEARRNLRGSTPELSVRRAVDTAQALRAFLGDSLPRLVQAVPDARLVDDSRAAIGDASRALDEFAGWLQRDFLPRAHGDLALGAQRWWDRLRLGEAMPGSIEVLLPRVEAALRDAERRVDDATRGLAGVTSATGVHPDPQRAIEDDHGKAEDLLPRVQALADQLLAWGAADTLLPLPTTGLPRVAPMPAQLFGYLRVIFPAPLEKRPREPMIFVDPVPQTASERARVEHLRMLNRPTLVVTLAHDVLGHFLVGLRRRQAPSLMQRVSASVLLDEGFAHYVERQLIDGGPYASDPKVRYVVERAAQLRLVRLLASIRFHAQGAKLDDIARLFGDECALDDYQAHKEAERVAVDPLAGADALGRLEIERLRTDWQAAHPGGSLGTFHQALLSHGGAPIELVREALLAEPDPAK